MARIDYYQLLGLSTDAAEGHIEQRIRERLIQARRLVSHPQRAEDGRRLLAQLREARSVLLDSELRRRYDQERFRWRQALPPVRSQTPWRLRIFRLQRRATDSLHHLNALLVRPWAAFGLGLTLGVGLGWLAALLTHEN